MKYKTCTKCGIENLLSEFCKETKGKNGLCAQCKNCCKIYRDSHKEEIKELNKIYYQFHKKERKIYLKKNRDRIYQQHKIYRLKNKQKIRKLKKEYDNIYKQEHKEYSKEYAQSHKQQKREYREEYYQSHKQEIKEYHQSHRKQRNKSETIRRQADINYKIRGNLRSRLTKALKGSKKFLSTMFLIGCDVEYLMYHLQCKFAKGMNWDNYGKGNNGKKEWQIDHIRPCALFDLSKPSEQRKCFNYINLQPLWAKDNIKKGSKYKTTKI